MPFKVYTRPPKEFAANCSYADECEFPNSECRFYSDAQYGRCYCVNNFQFNGYDCFPQKAPNLRQIYGAKCSTKRDCKFNRADCNERNICVCPKDPFPYLDVREHECISRDQYLARYPGLTTPKGWRPGLDQVDCDAITTFSSQSADGESIVKIVQNPQTTMPCKNIVGEGRYGNPSYCLAFYYKGDNASLKCCCIAEQNSTITRPLDGLVHLNEQLDMYVS